MVQLAVGHCCSLQCHELVAGIGKAFLGFTVIETAPGVRTISLNGTDLVGSTVLEVSCSKYSPVLCNL